LPSVEFDHAEGKVTVCLLQYCVHFSGFWLIIWKSVVSIDDDFLVKVGRLAVPAIFVVVIAFLLKKLHVLQLLSSGLIEYLALLHHHHSTFR
jgi:hypothetical protein